MPNNPSVPSPRKKVFDSHEIEDTFESRYYKLNKILLSAVAMWPSPNTWYKTIEFFILGCLYVNCLVIQLAPLATNECSVDMLIEIFSFVIPCMVFFLKFITFHVNSERIKEIFKHIQQDWGRLENSIELDILKQYGEIGRWYSITFTGSTYVLIVICVLFQLVPDFLDIIVPLNESREHHFPLRVEYFVDQEEYFHLILCNLMIITLVGATIIIASETLSIAVLQHAAGLFRITSYRMKHVFDKIGFKTFIGVDNYNTRIMKAVELHKRAINYTEYFFGVFDVSYGILLMFGTASLSLNIFRSFRSIHDFNKFLTYFFCCCINYGYMFILCYECQEVINHSNNVLNDAYDSRWYSAPPQLRKVLLLIMQRSMKRNNILLGKVFVPSLEGFTTVTSMSISYFMVIHSTRT